MRHAAFILLILLSSLYAVVYEVGNQISISDQQLSKEVCYAPPGAEMITSDSFNLYDLNGAYNGGEYHVIFMDFAATW